MDTVEKIQVDITTLLRKNVANMKPYSSARDEFEGEASIYLDANENPFNTKYNRYPDPYQREVKELISDFRDVDFDQIFLGNGSDEIIDLLFRAFCTPGVDNVLILPPTYGMYSVSAELNDVEIRKVNLNTQFQLNVDGILNAIDEHTKLLFICSPNNPTGNSMRISRIEKILKHYKGILVIDEAYIDFSTQESAVSLLEKYPNVIITQTFSKAWGLAGIRLGMSFSSTEMVTILNKIKPPYNISTAAQNVAIERLKDTNVYLDQVALLLEERDRLEEELTEINVVIKTYPTEANFILVKIKSSENAELIYLDLVNKGVVLRNRSNVELCGNCLRITVGTQRENTALLEALKEY